MEYLLALTLLLSPAYAAKINFFQLPTNLLMVWIILVWIIFFFCGVVSLNYSFVLEREFAALEGLLLSPVDPALVFISKVLVGWLFLLIVQTVVLIALGTLFGVALSADFPQLFLISAIIAFGFISLGTLFASIAACIPGRDIILPLLLFPLSLPALAGAVFVTREILSGVGINFGGFWFLLVVCFDIISFTLSAVLFEYAVREL